MCPLCVQVCDNRTHVEPERDPRRAADAPEAGPRQRRPSGVSAVDVSAGVCGVAAPAGFARTATHRNVGSVQPRADRMMFGRRREGTQMPARKLPPALPFQHGDRCQTKDAEPEWYDSGDGRWTRVCSCGSEFQAMYSGELEPAGTAAEPAKSAHEHFPECEGAQVTSMVTVEYSSADKCWRSHCLLCTSTYLYWYQPDRHETNHYGEPVPVRRVGNLFYDYPLASEQVPA